MNGRETGGPLYLSAPEVSGQQLELCENGQNGASSLNPPIQEVNRKQTSVGINPKKIWLKNYQHEISNIQTIKRKHPEHAIHIDEKRFKSEISKEDFVAPSEFIYEDSYRHIHTGKRPLSCSECTMNFTRADYLNEHMKIHSNRRPFSCSECAANFTTSGNLRRHIMIHTDKSRSLARIARQISPHQGICVDIQ
uniref:Zinc finger protein n=1 Tax=Loa loa TaxID=7209 RepID=A0A1I7W389_LOALO